LKQPSPVRSRNRDSRGATPNNPEAKRTDTTPESKMVKTKPNPKPRTTDTFHAESEVKEIPRPKLGDDAYWALDSVRQKLKTDIVRAKKHVLNLLKAISTEKGHATWNKNPNFSRAVIVFLPGAPAFGQQHWRELWLVNRNILQQLICSYYKIKIIY
jgi:hypothetical protein